MIRKNEAVEIENLDAVEIETFEKWLTEWDAENGEETDIESVSKVIFDKNGEIESFEYYL
jgi:hypothetical protein